MGIKLPRENRDKRTKLVVDRLVDIVWRFVQIKMEGNELVGTEMFAMRVEWGKRLNVHQRC